MLGLMQEYQDGQQTQVASGKAQVNAFKYLLDGLQIAATSDDPNGLDEFSRHIDDLQGDVKSSNLSIEQQREEEERIASEGVEQAKLDVLRIMREDAEGEEESPGFVKLVQDFGGAADSLEEQLVRREIMDSFTAAEARFEEEGKKLKDDFLVAVAEIPNSDGQLVPLSREGGWSADDHMRFMKVFKECAKNVQGRTREVYMERVFLALPHMNREQIESHDTWWQHYRFYQQQRREKTQTWERLKESMLQTYKERLALAKQEGIDNNARAFELDQLQSNRTRLHSKLGVMQKAKASDDEVERRRAEAMFQQKLEADRILQEKEVAERMLKKERIAVHRTAVDIARAEQQALEDARLTEEEHQRMITSAVNEQRVEFRAEKIQEKESALAEREVAKAAAVAESEERLQQIAAQTPYAEKIAAMEMDPERSRMDTKAFAASAALAGVAVSVTLCVFACSAVCELTPSSVCYRTIRCSSRTVTHVRSSSKTRASSSGST